MTPNEFRKIALSLPGATESEHGGHPDFRASGKVFASLGSPDDSWGMVKLTPEQQRSIIQAAPDIFQPCRGTWGNRGYTNVKLVNAEKQIVKYACELAFDNVVTRA
jgi:hypothetical protein